MAAVTADEKLRFLAFDREVGEQGFIVFGEDLRANRQFDDRGLSGGAVHVLAKTGTPVLRFDVLAISEIDQGIQSADREGNDIAAATTVITVRPTVLDVLFATERNATVPAVAALHINLCLIEKFHDFRPAERLSKNKKGEWLTIPLDAFAIAGCPYAAGSTEIVVRLRVLWNFTCPAVSADKV